MARYRSKGRLLALNQQAQNYFGKQASLATMHGKEAVVAPAFLDPLGIRVTRADVDTDNFGTFSGDVARKLPPLETAIAKAQAAIEQTGIPLGLASEGTIGPHPMLPIASSDFEIMVFIDAQNDLVISESVRSSEVVAGRTVVHAGDELGPFLQRADFPNHGLIVRTDIPSDNRIIKGITDLSDLEAAIAELAGAGAVVVETDLRAHFAPSRMKVIADCARLLAARVASRCPSCEAPGFGRIEPIFGVPCRECGERVETVVLADRMGCVKCDHKVISERLPVLAEPRFCCSCNP
jgi:hypothetical protein